MHLKWPALRDSYYVLSCFSLIVDITKINKLLNGIGVTRTLFTSLRYVAAAQRLKHTQENKMQEEVEPRTQISQVQLSVRTRPTLN